MTAAQEGAAAARRDSEAEKERFKKVIQELKKKLDRCSHLTLLLAGRLRFSCLCVHSSCAQLTVHASLQVQQDAACSLLRSKFFMFAHALCRFTFTTRRGVHAVCVQTVLSLMSKTVECDVSFCALFW